MKRFLIVLSAVGVLGFAACKAQGSNPSADPSVAKAPDVWIAKPSPVPYGDGIAYGAGNFVLVGSVDGNTETSFYSDDAGLSWTQASDFWGSNQGSTLATSSILYGNNTFVVAPNDAADKARVSADGKDWNDGGSLGGDVEITSFCFAKDKFYATKEMSNSAFWTSSNGVSWTENNIISKIYSIAYGTGKYIALLDNQKIAASTNGIDGWDVRDNTNDFNFIVYGSKFVATGLNSGLYYSDDDGTWLKGDSSFEQNTLVRGIIYAAGYYIAYGCEVPGYTGKMTYSADALLWTDIALPQGTNAVVDVGFGEDTFIAITKDVIGGGPSEILRCNMR